jgi:hypothetical protein
MKRRQSQNYSMPLRPIPAAIIQDIPKSVTCHGVEQRYVVKFFVESGMKGAEIIDSLNRHHSRDALQRMKEYCWMKEVKSGRNNVADSLTPERN